MNRRDIVRTLGAFLVGPSFMRAFDPYFDAEMPKFKGDKGFDWKPPDALSRLRALLLMLEEPIDELWAYRTALLGTKGEVWAGPQILEVTRDIEEPVVHFRMQDLQAKEPMTLKGIRLYHPSGAWRGEGGWYHGPVIMNPGDTLKASIDFRADGI